VKLTLDLTGVTFLAGSAPEPVRDFETGRPKTDPETGQALYQMQLIALQDGRTSVITAKATGTPPAVAQGAPLRVAGLVAIPWATEGRNGVAYRAGLIEPAKPPARTAS
jgi:hypothetical protein